MAEIATIARPYAEAAFRVAQGKKALAEWLDSLQLLAALVDDSRLRALLDDPKRSKADKQAALASLMADKASAFLPCATRKAASA